MDEETLGQEETQQFMFDFSARELCEEFEGMVNSYLNKYLHEVHETMNDVSSSNIPIEPIKEFYQKICQPALEQFKKTVHEIFYVPDNVELPLPVEFVKEDVTDEEVNQEEREIEELEKELMQARLYQAALKAKKEFVTKHIEPRLKVVDACLKAREEVEKVEEVIAKCVQELEEHEVETVESVYKGNAQAENPDFYKDKIGK